MHYILDIIFISASGTGARRVAEASRRKERCTVGPVGSKDKVCLLRSEASHLLNSVLQIRPHLASPLFNCNHHFSARLRPSQLVSSLTTLFHSSQVFHLFPPQLNSFHLFPACPNPSQRLSPLPTSSQLFPPLLTSAQLISTLISTLLISCQLFSTLTNSSQLFSPQKFYTEKLLHIASSTLFSERSVYTQKLVHRGVFAQSNLYHREAFTPSKFLH